MECSEHFRDDQERIKPKRRILKMKRGMKSFSRAVRKGDGSEAEEMMEKIVQGHMDDEVWEGYNRALEGAVEALNSDNDLTLPQQISQEKITLSKLKDLREEMEERASQEFRPADEIGFNKAWSTILQVIIEDATSD